VMATDWSSTLRPAFACRKRNGSWTPTRRL
jgi:hypothetical protein